ncbi:spore germination protein [Paenibacillus doosanensis]|uniref:Spore germination protein YndE n=1 Tax=Paenibacillus konkukensis TaxID=2020716 RepID=A0ABY4S1G0_9BACL|nr:MULTISPECIES: endospore germination permease [Paenibacillus]MCS7463330.1 spore germination protein [Paenibacillus doosanensis]UQZ87635.1 Spore germination protein YndE [Paenibacillus konkukensis]
MIENGKISAVQLGMLMYFMIGATATLMVPAITAKEAGRDMWLSPVWGSVSGFVIIYITWKLHSLYPHESIIQYGDKIAGRVIGKAGGFFVLFFLLHGIGLITREYGEFLVESFLSRTPILVIMGSLIFVCIFSVRGGLEVLARCTKVFFPFIVIIFVSIFLMLIPDMDARHILPLMEKGIGPSLKGSVVPHTWFIEFFLITFLYPFNKESARGLKWGMLAVLAMMLTMVFCSIASLFVFGNLTASYIFPVYVAASFISVADFIEHLDVVILMTWILGGFIQISLWFYALAIGTAQWLNLPDYRPLVAPLGLLSLFCAMWVSPNLQQLSMFFSTTAPFYSFTIQLIYPLLLLVIALCQRASTATK